MKAVLVFCLFSCLSASAQSDILAKAEKERDLKTFLSYYEKDAISMPEYQPALHGINEIETYYREIFSRHRITSFVRKAEEFFDFDTTVIEIGTFVKEFDNIPTQQGKYWMVWTVKPNGIRRLKAEAFGYFHPIKDPEALTVKMPVTFVSEKSSLELRAYKALNEEYVRLKDGALRSEFYADDARYMPFQEPTVTGIKNIRPYLIEYSNRGNINFDSLDLTTIHGEYLPGFILEYSQVKVKWHNADTSGRTEGKGIVLWKRQPDQSLKIYRHIGTHNYLK